ncbi:MerR family transcriptional regulator [Zhongshania aliphaticivorans]|nr:MerR family transcriptional regulator [Zhongshania aliphaticivorans]
MTTDTTPTMDDSGTFPIAELIDKSGVSREMIKYYLRDGLLPHPEKPRRNLSLYSAQHIKLIRLIRLFQKDTKLSLPEISKIFNELNHDPHKIELQLLSGNYLKDVESPLSHRIEAEIATNVLDGSTPELTESIALEFDQGFIATLKQHNLISAGSQLSAHDQNIAGLIWSAMELGVSLNYFIGTRTKIHDLVSAQIEVLKGAVHPDLGFADSLSVHYSADRIINRWLIAEKTNILRKIYLEIIDSVDVGLDAISDSIYIPSKAYNKRYKIKESIEQLALGPKPNNRQTYTAYAGACVFVADYTSAHNFIKQGLKAYPGDAQLTAIECLAYCLEQKPEDAAIPYQALRDIPTESIWTLEAKIYFLLIQASKVGGISDASVQLRQAYELFIQVAATPAIEPMEKLEALLIGGRARSMFPQWVSHNPVIIERLTSLLASLESSTVKELGLPIQASHAAYKTYAHFYLARAYDLENAHEKAQPHYEEVIKLDPASNFSAFAYSRLD